MRCAIMAFASRQARGRRQRKQSSAANSSSSRGLTIRCRTKTVIHRSGRCDKRDTKRHEKSPWMSPGIFLLLPATRPPPRAGEWAETAPRRERRVPTSLLFVFQDRGATWNAWNRCLAVDLSGARALRRKSEVLSIISYVRCWRKWVEIWFRRYFKKWFNLKEILMSKSEKKMY